MFRLTFLVAYLTVGKCYSEEASSILTRLPDIIGTLCPGANVCRENQSVQASEMTFQPGVESCCTECSCQTDCTKNGNCCFPDKQTFQHEDQDSLNILPDRLQCLFPMTFQPNEEEQIFYQSYFMVSSAYEISPDDRKLNSNISCGDEIVTPWGSLYPVYSASNRQIYKNTACATASGVTDGILWDAILKCNTDIFHQTDVSMTVLELDSFTTPDYCELHFIYPGEIRDVQSLECYVSLNDTCLDSDFKMPDAIDISKEDIIELCTSGFVSPYRYSKMYANVFCHICNGEKFAKVYTCPEKSDYSITRLKTDEFVGLLDFDFIDSLQKRKDGNAQKIPMACDFKDDSRCRPIFCPSGQLRDLKGNCRNPSKLWYDQEYTININLTTDESFNIAEVFHSVFGETDNILPALKSPWPKKWFICRILEEIHVVGRTSKTSKALLVQLKNTVSSVPPKNLLQTIKRMFMRSWFLEHNNATIEFKQTFAKYTTLSSYEPYEIIIASGNRSETVTTPTFQMIYNKLFFYGNTHYITQLYVCNQVELIQSEFNLSFYKTVLFNLITHRFMFNGEFILIPSDSFDGVRARICIEDSGMRKVERVQSVNSACLRKGFVLRFLFTILMKRAFI